MVKTDSDGVLLKVRFYFYFKNTIICLFCFPIAVLPKSQKNDFKGETMEEHDETRAS